MIDIKGVVPVQAETLDGRRVQRVFPGRQQVDGADLLQRALGVGAEGAQAVDLVIQQVHPVGQVAAHRENVQQRAAQGKLAMLVDGFDVAVSVALQVAAEGFSIQHLSGLQDQAGPRHVVHGGQAVHQGGHRHDQDARCQAGQPVQCFQSFGHDVLMR